MNCLGMGPSRGLVSCREQVHVLWKRLEMNCRCSCWEEWSAVVTWSLHPHVPEKELVFPSKEDFCPKAIEEKMRKKDPVFGYHLPLPGCKKVTLQPCLSTKCFSNSYLFSLSQLLLWRSQRLHRETGTERLYIAWEIEVLILSYIRLFFFNFESILDLEKS